MLYAFRTLAEDTGEFPRAELFDPPFENLLRMICRQTNHPLNSDAIWIVGFLDDDR